MERLQKVIAQAGIASRRKAEQLILDGVVEVNGEIVRELGTKVSNKDRVAVNGVEIVKEEFVYYLLYKPTGYLSTVEDDRGRKTVLDLMPQVEERIFPVGRLDYDTSGLLLMTNDGDFSYLLTHPKYEVPKTYFARVRGIPRREDLKKLARGVELDDGKTAPAYVKTRSIDKQRQRAIVEITIHEGRNRQVRRMFDHIGYPVDKLKRERFGLLDLVGMNAGDYRPLTIHEVKQLRVLAERGQLK